MDDLKAAVAAAPDAILAPKVSSAEDLIHFGERLVDLHAAPELSVWAMIETPLAILNVREIAAEARDALAALKVLIMGTNDLAKNADQDRSGPRADAALPHAGDSRGRAYGIDIVDGVYNDIANAEGFARECAEGRDLGFDGKTLIHPTRSSRATRHSRPRWRRSSRRGRSSPSSNCRRTATRAPSRLTDAWWSGCMRRSRAAQ